MKKSQEEKAKEWMEAQESTPRPGSTFGKQYIPKGVTLNPIVKMVSPSSLKPNPRNDFDPLTEEEYTSLKENIALNGILDALTARKDGTLVTGENRYRIALELKNHEDENVRRRVESIPVRYYMNELNAEEEYDILEGDNLFRRHLTAEQKKERLKRRILRKYKDDLLQDNRGGDRKSESSHSLVENTEEETNGEGSSDSEMLSEEESNNGPHRLIEDEEQKRNTSSSPEGQTELGLFFGEVGALEEQAQGTRQKSEGLKTGPDEKSNYQGDSLIEGLEMLSEGLFSEKSKDQGDLLIGNSSKDLEKKESSTVKNNSQGSNHPEGLKSSHSSTQSMKGSKIQDESLKTGSNKKSNYQGDSLIEKPVELAKKVSENENIPLGTARRYVTELKKELKTKDPKSASKKREVAKKKDEEKKTPKQILQAKVKEFQKKYGKMSYEQKEAALERLLNSLRKVRKQQADLHKKTMELGSKDSELVELISAVGQEKRIWKLKV